MSAIGQSTSAQKVSQTHEQSSANHETTSENPLENSRDNSNLTTGEAHPNSTTQFTRDTDVATRSRWASRWQASLRIGGHFLQGLFGVAAFRATYVRARGQLGEQRAGPMLVRYDSGSVQGDLSACKRTQQQAKTASWSQLIGALPTIPLSALTGFVGGLLGLCARAHRAYQQHRMRDDDKYEQTRDRLITAAMRRIVAAAMWRNGAKKGPGEPKDQIDVRVMFVAEAVKRAADCWRTACGDDPATPVTESTLKQQITRMVDAFDDLATISYNPLNYRTLERFRILAIKWTQTGDKAVRDKLVDQIADTVERWKVYLHVCKVCEALYKARYDDVHCKLDIDPERPFENRVLKLQPSDFHSEYDSVVTRALDNTWVRDRDSKNAVPDAKNEIRDRVFQKWASQPPHSLYKIVTTIK